MFSSKRLILTFQHTLYVRSRTTEQLLDFFFFPPLLMLSFQSVVMLCETSNMVVGVASVYRNHLELF
jgi:hypothetical protein